MQARFYCQHHFRLSVGALAGASLLSPIGLGLVYSFLTWEGGEEGWLDGVQAEHPIRHPILKATDFCSLLQFHNNQVRFG